MTTQISGTTGVSQVQAGSINQDDLAANVVGKGPAFSAYSSTGTTLTAAQDTQVLFQTKEYDTNNNYDASTSTFNPKVPGYYQVNARVGHTSLGGNEVLTIYKNGFPHRKGFQILQGAGSGIAGSAVSALVYLDGVADYIAITCYVASAITTSTGAVESYFQGYLARAA